MTASHPAPQHVLTLLEHVHARTLMDMIAAEGYTIRLVGGCVRDALLQLPIGDMDMATDALPQQLMQFLKKEGVKTIPTGIDHGTITVHINGHDFEITTLRKDVATDGRHAEIAFTDDWQQDALRRDLTINALSLDQNGIVYDYFGGLDDLKAQTLRFVGDAATRIREDYLRLLRLFRFSSVLNWPLSDNALLETCRQYAPNLRNLSRERIQNELYKMLSGYNAVTICRQMEQYSIWQSLLAEHTIHIERLEKLVALEQENDHHDSFRRMIALIGWDDMAVLEAILVLTRDQKKRLKIINQAIHDIALPIEHLLYFYGIDAVYDAYYLSGKQVDTHYVTHWTPPVFPIDAETVMREYDLNGAALGHMLKQAEKWWVENGFKPDKQAVLNYMLTVLPTHTTQI